MAGEDPILIAHAAAIALDKAESYDDAGKTTMKLQPPEGAMVFGAVASGKMLPEMDVVSEVIKHAGQFTIALAERDDSIEAAVSMTAASRERARDITDVIDGIFALVRLNAEDNEWFAHIAQFTRQANVQRTGREVTITVKAETAEVIELLGMVEEH